MPRREQPSGEGFPQGSEEHLARPDRPSPQHHQFGVGHQHEVGEPDRDLLGERSQDEHRSVVTAGGGLRHVLAPHRPARLRPGRQARGGTLGDRATGEQAERRPRRQRLPTAPLSAAALEPVPVHDHVTDLAGEAVRTTTDRAVHDQRPADPRAEGDDEHVARPPRRSRSELRDRSGGCVVVDDQSPPGQERCERRQDGQVRDALEVRSARERPVGPDQAREAEADGHRVPARGVRVRVRGLELPDQGGKGREERRRA